MQSPQLQIFNKVFDYLQGLGVTVITRKEMMDEIPYPFFVVSYANEQNKSVYTFDSFNGKFNIKVDLFSLGDDYGKHDYLLRIANDYLSNFNDLDEYTLKLNDLTNETLTENTTNQALLHSVLITEYDAY
ncbi:hypothetical protein [Staphylococcus sp. IVB6227]|uniref:hypothetical protein n=1 Tax=Staphylococcus sp. IVB6227 TaxID=2989768 RepID=UPI0021CF01AA|nr:hypothetical protein [Staphylococcus sp. IVB6227]UXR79054.1 hypothetical protein MUA92_03960 [Staphylococcus sp. IVB6227]